MNLGDGGDLSGQGFISRQILSALHQYDLLARVTARTRLSCGFGVGRRARASLLRLGRLHLCYCLVKGVATKTMRSDKVMLQFGRKTFAECFVYLLCLRGKA